MTELTQGSPLPTIVKRVTQDQVQRYARASGDHNPVHLDARFAAGTSFGRPIAHGMLSLAFLSELLAQVFGQHWLESGKLRVRFKAPVYPGEELSMQGWVTKEVRHPEYRQLECSVTCRDKQGRDVVLGTASVKVPLT
ncbi:MAG: MaoC family dehydratase [Dehalococcoidia bacterium]